jgi:23S rRNA-/tRNA-specific pseudouridylate synthase
MAKPDYIELSTGERIPILYEDRSVLAIDKPRGWMLVPVSWQNTSRNLQAALTSSIAARDFWARSRNLKY